LALRTSALIATAAFVLAAPLLAAPEQPLVVAGLTGKPGGRLVYAERTEPKTLNPLFASDAQSRDVIHRLNADLVHINRATLKTEPALAKSCTISSDGLHYTLELRQGLRFSDGHPFDADDVLFTHQIYLDPEVGAPQRSLWLLDEKPIKVRKLGPYRVVFDLPRVNAVGERLFDGVPMLPRHLLERAYREGKLSSAWGLRTPPAEIAGMGPFRLKEYVPGQRIVLEKNPYYWKVDSAGTRLPYLSELTFTIAGTEAMQVMRFQSGESDLINRVGARDWSVLSRDKDKRGYVLNDLGPGYEFSFVVFNLNQIPAGGLPQVASRQTLWRRLAFRRAVSAAIDRGAIVRLAYQGLASPLASLVAAGNRLWVNGKLPAPTPSVARARELLAADGFKWSKDGALLDPEGKPAAFTLAARNSDPQLVQMATLIQADLKPLGIQVDVVPLEFRSLADRVTRTHDYEAAIITLVHTDADPSVDINLWLSNGSSHFWNLDSKSPAPWEVEIDRLMRQQMITRQYAPRKQLFDRVQELAAENLPVIPLVTPNLLVGARKSLANLRPALLDPYTLWNVDELYWQNAAAGVR
jgi:peptide/nickel transport system substrate-binding protein